MYEFGAVEIFGNFEILDFWILLTENLDWMGQICLDEKFSMGGFLCVGGIWVR